VKCLLTAAIFLITAGFVTAENYIVWNKDRPLLWDDFQSKPNSSYNEGARATTSILIDFINKTDPFLIEINAVFYPKRSWFRKGYDDDDGLKHEQGHFDITEIFARKFRKQIILSAFSKNNFSKKIEKACVNIRKNLIEYHKLYDEQTNHYLNKEKQTEWNEKIANQLIELEKYSNPIVEIKIRK